MIDRRSALTGLAVGACAIGLGGLSACATPPPVTNESLENPQTTGESFIACATSDVPVRGGKTFTVNDQAVLITQPTEGTFKAFLAVCTHAGVKLNRVLNGEIVCDGHGAVFNAETGMVQSGPAPRALNKIAVEVIDGSVSVTL